MRRFAELDSTNRYALDQARQGAAAGLVAVADHQTAGRGRLGRPWVSPPGASLLVSVLMRPDLPPRRRHLATAAVGLAAAEACDDVAGFRPGLKWPNDLVCDEAKLGGILAEADGTAVVVGMGINVDWPAEELHRLGATCLAARAGRPVDRDQLLACFLERLGGWYGRWDEVARAYGAQCVTVGRQVRVALQDGVVTGSAVDVDDDGHLVVEVDGRRHEIAAGDVVHLRARGPDRARRWLRRLSGRRT